MINNWVSELPIPVTVCDENGIILSMNLKSIELFKEDGGQNLIGKSLLDCHPEPSKTKLLMMMNTHIPNTYISENDGQPSLIHESPWYEDGNFKGYVEFNIPLPPDIKKDLSVR